MNRDKNRQTQVIQFLYTNISNEQMEIKDDLVTLKIGRQTQADQVIQFLHTNISNEHMEIEDDLITLNIGIQKQAD